MSGKKKEDGSIDSEISLTELVTSKNNIVSIYLIQSTFTTNISCNHSLSVEPEKMITGTDNNHKNNNTSYILRT
jgi:hypothetical protein